MTRAVAVGPELGALHWIKTHRAKEGGVVVSSRVPRLYPEVTGYLIPTLIRRGERDLALAFARCLVGVQRPDGSFADPAGRASYAFDTGQVLRGFVAALPHLPELADPLRRACEWLLTSADRGRLPVPTAAEWSLGARGAISEAVHLYVLPGLLAASEALGEPRYRRFVAESMDWYARHVEIAEFKRPHQLTHLFAYAMEALIELGAGELAAVGMKQLADAQHDTGLVPAYSDVAWLCTPGQFQCALVWAKLGDRVRARAAFGFMEQFRNGTGGFFGSYGPGADYFAAEEPSWAAKFELDAADALATATVTKSAQAPKPPSAITAAKAPKRAATPSSTSTSTNSADARTNLAPEAWHEAIVDGAGAAEIAERVRRGAVPQWIEPVLAASKTGDRVLELGSGTGELSAALARAGRRPTCVDFSAASLDLAERVFGALGVRGSFVEADVTRRLPFPDASFDVVWSSGLLEHFDAATQAHIVAEAARVSRRGVVALVPNAKSLPYRLGKSLQEAAGTWAWGKEDPFLTLRPQFEAAGLVDVEETTIAPEHALEFLNGTPCAALKAPLAAWLKSLPATERGELGQGYLLATTGRTRLAGEENSDDHMTAGGRCDAPRRIGAHSAPACILAIVPNDPLQAYVDAGYPDLTSYFNPAGRFDEVVCLSPHEKKPTNLFGVRVIPTAPRDLARRCKELGVSVLRAYDIPAATLIAPHRPPGVPFVVSVHDVDPARVKGPLPDADLWLPVSGACATFLRERGADPAKIAPFSNRVDLEVFRPRHDPAKRAAFEARFPGKRRVLHVGRHCRQKNQDRLLESLSLLGRDYVGVFVGKGDVEATRLRAAELGVASRCHFVECVPNAELADYYSFCDVMCTPSRWEGFGVVFIEAAAAGAVIVTCDVAPMNELLKHGETALLVSDPEDSPQIAAAIKTACTNGAARAGLRRRAPEAARPFAKNAVEAVESAAYDRLLKPVARAKPAAGPAFAAHALTAARAADWERLVLSSPEAWLYHTWDEQTLLEEAWGGETLSFLVERAGRLVAAVPLQRWPWDRATFWGTLMGPAGPALARDLDPHERQETLAFAHGVLREFVRLKKAKAVRIHLPPLAPALRATWNDAVNPLVAFGYEDVSTKTSVIDLSKDEDALWGGMRPEYRTCINKATREGVIVEAASDPSDVDAYYRLHVETYVRTGVKPHPKEYFAAIFDRFVATGRAEWLFAKRDGELLGALNVARYGDASLYWTGAYSAEGLGARVAKLLQWEAIRRSKGRGCAYHETGEIVVDAAPGSKDHGIGTFKRRFGGELVPFWKGIVRA
jgi:glycosyltransferase involved in cell wall biosynthesis/SAM-dependent methyltransferase